MQYGKGGFLYAYKTKYSYFYAAHKDSALEIKSVKSLCGCAMLTALHVVISSVRIVISNLLEISFSYLAVGVCA